MDFVKQNKNELKYILGIVLLIVGLFLICHFQNLFLFVMAFVPLSLCAVTAPALLKLTSFQSNMIENFGVGFAFHPLFLILTAFTAFVYEIIVFALNFSFILFCVSISKNAFIAHFPIMSVMKYALIPFLFILPIYSMMRNKKEKKKI